VQALVGASAWPVEACQPTWREPHQDSVRTHESDGAQEQAAPAGQVRGAPKPGTHERDAIAAEQLWPWEGKVRKAAYYMLLLAELSWS
jgi:hypothetical protein